MCTPLVWSCLWCSVVGHRFSKSCQRRKWAWPNRPVFVTKKGGLDEIVDPYLTGQIAPMALQKFAEVAENWVREHGNERPTMWDIVGALELTCNFKKP
ncbi:hypothetical protein SLE2022_190490 [Rubroshorea leprosula]